jgi:hypothetical protein
MLYKSATPMKINRITKARHKKTTFGKAKLNPSINSGGQIL